jgi:asparagine synthase (glutamine-hydrolysing)
MCGIFGRFAWNGEPPDVERMTDLVQRLRHRGPDAGGYWADGPYFLGHRRLAILDLSPTGAQPMSTADGRLVVVLNGEIYNFVELKRELEDAGFVFRTRSDTEVILHGWRAWGEGLFNKLVGMFAFALADRDAGELVLARDRFGEKPLLYVERAGTVFFASELGPLAECVPDRRMDPAALAGYLCLNFVPGDRTMLDGVRRLRPGTARRYGRNGAVSEIRWWQPTPENDVPSDRKEVLDVLRTRIDNAVRIGLRSDVPIALFLSGGIDSSIVAESAVRQGALQAAFCLDVREPSFSEWDNAAWVAQRLGVRLERVTLGSEVLDDFLSIVSHADDPLADSSAVAVWQLARATARQFKVAVSGDGGDELFGGYLTYKATAWHNRVTSRLGPLRRHVATGAGRMRARETKVSASYKMMRFLRAADLPPAQAHFSWNGAWLPGEAAELLTEDLRPLALDALASLARDHAMSERPSLSELQRVDAVEYLPNDILVKVDRMTMAHSLESRAPLLHPDVASLAFATTERFAGTPFSAPKRLLRDLADERFGPRVSRAKKQGFSIPIHSWLRDRRALVEDLLGGASIQELGLFDVGAVDRARRRFLDGTPLGFEIWGLMVLVAWYRARMVSSPRVSGARDLERAHVP